MPEGLNKFDTDRWNNLNALDSANEKLNDLRQNGVSVGDDNLRTIDDKISSLDKEHQAKMDKSRIHNSHIDAELGKENSRYEDAIKADRNTISYYKGREGYEDIVEKSKGNIQRESELHDARVKEIEKRRLNSESMAREDADYHSKRAQFLDRRKEIEDANRKAIDNQQRVVDTHKDREKKFADVSSQFGMSGRTFESASDMNISIKARDTRIEQMRQKAMTMGIKKEDLRGLTPEARQELADMQRKNIRSKEIRSLIHKGGEHVVTTAVSGAVKTAGAFIGAATFAYGGEEASLAGVQVGSYIGQTAYNKTAGRVVRATHYAVNNADLLLGIQSPPATGNTVNKGAGGRTKVSTKPTQPKQTKTNKPVEQKKTGNASPKAANVSATSEAGSRASKGIKLDK